MQPGIVATYTHSDGLTQGKGACMIRVLSQTDFAARTADFLAFAKKAAQFAYGANTTAWADVVAIFPEIEIDRLALAKSLSETVVVDRIVILRLDS